MYTFFFFSVLLSDDDFHEQYDICNRQAVIIRQVERVEDALGDIARVEDGVDEDDNVVNLHNPVGVGVSRNDVGADAAAGVADKAKFAQDKSAWVEVDGWQHRQAGGGRGARNIEAWIDNLRADKTL